MKQYMTLLPVVLLPLPAMAGLEFCNETGLPLDVAIGYSDNDVWTSEGWWNLEPYECATIVPGDLKNRYYYWYADNQLGAFRQDNYTFCTSREVFTIRGDTDCEARGYEATGFNEEDTGDARHWVIPLTEADAPQGTADAGSRFDGTPQQSAGTDYSGYARMLIGYWQDRSDDSFGTRIQDGIMTDYFANIVAGEATWELGDTCPGGRGLSPVMFVKYQDIDELLCWEIVTLTEDEFIFRAVGGEKDVVMRRK